MTGTESYTVVFMMPTSLWEQAELSLKTDPREVSIT